LRRRKRCFVIVSCLFMAVLLSLACAFDDGGGLGITARVADGRTGSPDDAPRARAAEDPSELVAEPRTSMLASALLATVPGGLCLLI